MDGMFMVGLQRCVISLPHVVGSLLTPCFVTGVRSMRNR